MSPAPRIVSLISSATEMLYALGLGDAVQGVSHECDYPPEVAGKTRVTKSNIQSDQMSQQIDAQVQQKVARGEPLYKIDEFRLLDLAPDVIVTQTQCDVCAVRYADVLDVVHRSEVLKNTTVVALNPQTMEDVFFDILQLGEVLACQLIADEYVHRLRDRVDWIRLTTGRLPASQRPRVACVEWIDPLMLAGNWMPELVEFAGGDYPLDKDHGLSIYHNWSDLVSYDPQVLVVMPCGFNVPRTVKESQTMIRRHEWLQLAAVKSDRVFAVDANSYFNRSGPRLVDSLEILAHFIHPRLFAAPEIGGDPAFVRL